MKKLLIILGFVFNTYAQTRTWTINKDHSEITFKIPYLSISETSGRFTRFIGSIYFDEDLSLPEKIKLSIEVDSIYTANKLRDGHLRKKDFFHVKKFPLIYFESSKIQPISPGNFEAIGTLNLKGQDSKLKVQFSLSDSKKDSWGKVNKFSNFQFNLNRIESGLTWGKKTLSNQYLIGETVKVFGSFQLQPKDSKTLGSKHLIPDTKEIRLREKIARGEIKAKDVHSLKSINPMLKNNKPLAPVAVKAKKIIIEKEFQKERSLYWWSAYCFLSLFGMVSVTLSSIMLKNTFSKRKNYQEQGASGILTDIFITFPLIALYALAAWFVGYGV